MNTKEIINKNELSTEEMVFVVQEFIKEKKGVDININLLKGLHPQNPLFALKYSGQISMLDKAYDKALAFFMENPCNSEK